MSALILLWLGIVPGLIYVAWFYGGDLLCPHCGGKARDIPHELACELARDPSGQSIVPRQRQAGILVAIVAALALALAAVAILAAMRHF